MIAPYPLTFRQQQLLRFIAGYVEANSGIAPTRIEMARGLGCRGKGTVNRLVDALEERGAIRRLRRRGRAIEVLVDVAIPRTDRGAPLHFIPMGDPS
ncbi:LexA family protein [Novosphingobium aquimarinum]|uniref:LexA family protein n=1 Tax=Novosphingobium aquimarinum TaxID=2682494 RepID=UPI0012EB1001|nr:hypothetical protein [Novosphingobium aquimarinum]